MDVTPLDLFKPGAKESDKAVVAARYAICEECPFFNAQFKKCRKCGCFMQLKTTLHRAKCPEGKW